MENSINKFGDKLSGLGKQKKKKPNQWNRNLTDRSLATTSILHPMNIIHYVLQRKWGVSVNPSNMVGKVRELLL